MILKRKLQQQHWWINKSARKYKHFVLHVRQLKTTNVVLQTIPTFVIFMRKGFDITRTILPLLLQRSHVIISTVSRFTN